MSALHQLYQRGKRSLNRALDRTIDAADAILMGKANGPARFARFAGNAAWLLRDVPRLPAYRLAGENGTIVFVGSDHELLEARDLFFDRDQVEPESIGRTPIWKLTQAAQRWFAEGAALVICELSRIHPWRPKAALALTVPIWIRQIVPIPDRVEDLIAGRQLHSMRHRITRAERNGFGYRFTRERADFDHFYHEMYAPFIQARHNQLAMPTPYDDMWRREYSLGGLILATRRGEPVAGAICYMHDGACRTVEGGVLHADPQLYQQGINVLLDWYSIQWGHAQGAHVFDMGASRAWRSNRIFQYKSRWRTKVVRFSKIYSEWTLVAQQPSAAWLDRVNAIGFISEIDGKFYGVVIDSPVRPVAQADLDRELDTVRDQGLDGLAIVCAGKPPRLISKTTTHDSTHLRTGSD